MTQLLDGFIHHLQKPLPFATVFNPWSDFDPQNEIEKKGPKVRRKQLAHYLETRLQVAKYLLIGEALGYQGGHFTGIAMTSERILLGHQIDRGILPHHVLPHLEPRRTSHPSLKPKGFTEPTATIVWQKLLEISAQPLRFVLWNAFAWHPYQQDRGYLSNRRPTRDELHYGLKTLKIFLDLYPGARLISVGRVAAGCLTSLGIKFHPVRHPAQGGASEFRKQVTDLLDRT